MAFNIVPMSTDVAGGAGGAGGQDALVQALLARNQRQSTGQRLMAAGSAPREVYSRGVGMMMLANGALGGFLEGQEERRQQALARQGAEGAAQLAGTMGLNPQQTQALRAMMLANPQAASSIMQAFMSRLTANPTFTDGYDAQGNRVQRMYNPQTRQLEQVGGPARDVQRVGPGDTVVDVSRMGPAAVPQGSPQAAGPAPQGAGPAAAAPPASGAPAQPGVLFQGRGFRTVTDPAERRALGVPESHQGVVQVGPDGRVQTDHGPPNTQVTTSVNTASNPLVEGFSRQFTEQRERATAAADSIRGIHDARRQLDEPGGVIAGAFAQGRVDLARLGSYFGITDPRALQNTQAFQAAVGGQILSGIRALGTNPSRTDLEFMERMAGGQIALEPGAIRRILDIQENAARQAIERYNTTFGQVSDELGRVPGADQNGLAISRVLGRVAMPDPYTAPQGAIGPPPPPGGAAPGAAQAAPAPASQAPQMQLPEPGAIMDGFRFRGGNPADPNSWEPAQ